MTNTKWTVVTVSLLSIFLLLQGFMVGWMSKDATLVNRQAVTCLGEGFHQFSEYHVEKGQTVDWAYGIAIDGPVQRMIVDEGGVLKHQADLVFGPTTLDTTVICVAPDNRWTDEVRDCVSLGWLRNVLRASR